MGKIWLHLEVNPEPWAVGPIGFARKGGRMTGYMGQNKQLNAYKEAVAEAVADKWLGLPMLEGKLKVHFYFWRNQAEYTTPADLKHRKHEADATNMQKATEDALQGIVYKNDKDNVMAGSVIMEQGPDVKPQIVVCIETVEEGWQLHYLEKFPPEIIKNILDVQDRTEQPYPAPPPYAVGDVEEIF